MYSITPPPQAAINTIRLYSAGQVGTFLLIIVGIMILLVTAAVVYIESAKRKIPVQYAKRVVGRKVYGGGGIVPDIEIEYPTLKPIEYNLERQSMFFNFAVSFIAKHPNLPVEFEIWVNSIANQFAPGSFLYTFLYAVLIIFFCYFYTAVVLNPVDMADNMKKYGGFIPGIRPGQRTSDYIYRVMSRLTFVGALYLTAISILPELLVSYAHVPFYFGGTSVLIVIVVAMDTAQQIETHMISRNYEGFLKKGRVKSKGSW